MGCIIKSKFFINYYLDHIIYNYFHYKYTQSSDNDINLYENYIINCYNIIYN